MLITKGFLDDWATHSTPNKSLTHEIGCRTLGFAVAEICWLDLWKQGVTPSLGHGTHALSHTNMNTFSAQFLGVFFIMPMGTGFLNSKSRSKASGNWSLSYPWFFPPLTEKNHNFFQWNLWDSAELSRTLWKTRDPAWRRFTDSCEADFEGGTNPIVPYSVSSIYLIYTWPNLT